MSITAEETAFASNASETFSLSKMFTTTASTNNPTYIVLTALDRDEYTAGASGATGTFSGNGETATFSSIGGDGRGVGIVFTYQSSTGEYYNSSYGYLNQLTYTSSSSLDDVTDLSLFGTNDLATATLYANDAYDMVESDPAGYIASATVVTSPTFTGTVPSQATPNSIAALAESFVGDAWNMSGCWLLASTIAAEAGASLPVQTTDVGVPGRANGEWIVAYNGPAGQTGNWQSMVTAGDIIVIETAGGTGHVTTCVSGSGSTAMLLDNASYVNSSGQITNLANDGSSSDIIIGAAHAASQEWAQVSSSTTVVIYRLDTPVVTAALSSKQLAAGASLALAPVFSATDPAGKAITEWQVYDTAATDSLVLNGARESDHSAAAALTVTSLSALSLLAGSAAATDNLAIRAFNGSYWGDWTTLSVAVSGSGQSSGSAPVVAFQTAAQTWLAGTTIDLALASSTFHDPQNEALTYSATLSSGQALPSWLTFNAATDTFTGKAPTTAQTLTIAVTATDTGGRSATEDFAATVTGPPVLAAQTGTQAWTEGQTISLTLPSTTFTDPQHEALTYKASLSNGQALPGWLTFNGTTETFSGNAPTIAQSLNLMVTATNSSGLSTAETFAATVAPPPPPPPDESFGINVTNPTPSQVWTDKEAVNFALPSNTFTDALGLPMTFASYDVSGPSTTSWLNFNTATDTFSGTVPTGESGTSMIAVMAMDQDFQYGIDMFNVTFTAATGHVTESFERSAASPVNVAPIMAELHGVLTGLHASYG